MRGRGPLIVAIAAVLVVLLAFWALFIRPRRNDLEVLRQQVQAEQDRTQALQAELDRLEALQARAPELQAELEEIRERIPRQNSVPNFIFQVQEAANRSGVGFLRITPELPDAPLEGAQVAEITVGLEASGGYFSVQDFVRRLYNLDRALRIDLLTLTGEEGAETPREGRVAFTGTARIFFELPEDVPPATNVPAAPGAPVPAPGQEASPTASPSPTA